MLFDKNIDFYETILSKQLEKLSSRQTQKYNKNTDNLKYTNTFVIEYSSRNPLLNYDYLIKKLESYGLKQSKEPKANHLFGIISNKFYETNFNLLNNFQLTKYIEDKFNLFVNMEMYFTEFYNKNYPKSFMLLQYHKWEDLKNELYIARPIEGEAGHDIIVIDNKANFQKTQKILMNPKYSGISLTQYVKNPLLFNGHKMHLRVYFAITLINNVFNSYLLDEGCIYIAKNKYKNEDWNNKDIHDTHFGNSRRALYFPDDLYKNTKIQNETSYQIIYNKMCEHLEYVSKIASINIYQYETTKNTFEVFGIDFLIKDDLTVFIMELNARYVGYEAAKNNEHLIHKYFDWIDDIAIKPCLFPNLEIIKSRSNTSIYTCKILNY